MKMNSHYALCFTSFFVMSCHDFSPKTPPPSEQKDDDVLCDSKIEINGAPYYMQEANYIMVDSSDVKDTIRFLSTNKKSDSDKLFEVSIKHKDGADQIAKKYTFKLGHTSSRALYLDNENGSLLEYHSASGYLDLCENKNCLKGSFELVLRSIETGKEIELFGEFQTKLVFKCTEINSDGVVREVGVESNEYCKLQSMLF